MAKTQLDVSEKVSRKTPSNGIDPRSIRNEILLALPAKECAAVLGELEFMEMPAHDLLNEMGETIEFCYFMNSGMTSILTIMGDGKGVEVGLTGKEGFIGQVPATGEEVESVRPGTGDASHSGSRLQPRTQRGTAPGPLVADESRPSGGESCASDSGVSFAHAGNAARQRDGGRGGPSESGTDQICPRLRDHCGPKQAGTGVM